MRYLSLQQADIDTGPRWLQEIPARPDHWRDAHTRAFAANDGDRLVAAGMMWTSRVHGDRYWFEIAVDPDQRRRGHGRAMFAHLSEQRSENLPFIARGFANDIRMDFARALGAHTIQVVPPSQILTSSRHVLREQAEVHAGADFKWRDIVANNAATYEWTHAAWSPVGRDFASAVNEDFEDDLDLEASSFAVIDGVIVANCLVYRDSTPPVVTAETVNAHVSDGERLVEGCVRRSLDILATRGIDEVEFDGHVSDPHFLPVWTRLSPTGRWFHLAEVLPRTKQHES